MTTNRPASTIERETLVATKSLPVVVTRPRVRGGETARLVVRHVQHGWEVSEERGEQVIRVVRCSDWHRVERSIQLFDRQDDDARTVLSRSLSS
jgi:hypothetical protein